MNISFLMSLKFKTHFSLTLAPPRNVQIQFQKILFFKIKMSELALFLLFPLNTFLWKQKHSTLPDPVLDKNYNIWHFKIFFGFLKSQIVSNSDNINKVECFTNGRMQNRNYFVNLTQKSKLYIPCNIQRKTKVMEELQRLQERNGHLREKKILQHVIYYSAKSTLKWFLRSKIWIIYDKISWILKI